MNTDILKGKLTQEKTDLEKQLAELGVKDPKSGDWGAVGTVSDPADLADKNDAADRAEQLMDPPNLPEELPRRYRPIIAALAKMEGNDGSYGVCEISGHPIEEDRLMANPAAKTCKEHM